MSHRAPDPLARRAWIVVGVSAAIALAAIALWRYTARRSARPLVPGAAYVIGAPAHASRTVTLPDGSEATLDAGSRLTYDGGYGRPTRDVVLDGAARFDVARGGAPFRVSTRNVVVEGEGRGLVVRSGPNVSGVEIAVGDGRATVRVGATRARDVALGAGESVRIAPDGSSTVARGAAATR